MVHGDRWNTTEINILVENYSIKNLEELLKLLPNRCHDGIRVKARRLGLKK